MNKLLRALPLVASVMAPCLIPSVAFGATLYKCKDARGQTTYSDKDCRPPAPRVILAPKAVTSEPAASKTPSAIGTTSATGATNAAAVAATPAPSEPAVTKLTPGSVEALLRHALEVGVRGDFRAQCALAAPDIRFSLTERTMVPEIKITGGKREICVLQQAAAEDMTASGMSFSYSLGKMGIEINANATQATAKYALKYRISDALGNTLSMHCDREEVLALYSGKILFKHAVSVCMPVR